MLGQIGKYELLEKISEGGMGELYRARAIGPGGFERVVALKRIRSASDKDEAFIEMFVEEAKVASLLSHQNLVHLYDFGSEGDVHYLAMEMVEGRDLGKVLARAREKRRPFPIPAAVRVAHQTLLGLDYLHRLRHRSEPLQLVHRDVSPQNIMLSFDGAVKLTDFGIARMKRQERLTHVGVVKGKLGYLAPEQIADLPIDSRSDLFSMGIVLWECLTGARLFPGAANVDVVRQVLEKPIRPPSALNAEVSPALDAVVMHALDRDRERRFSSAGDMARALADLAQPMATEAELAAELRRLFPADASEQLLGLGSSAELSPAPEPTHADRVSSDRLRSEHETAAKRTQSMDAPTEASTDFGVFSESATGAPSQELQGERPRLSAFRLRPVTVGAVIGLVLAPALAFVLAGRSLQHGGAAAPSPAVEPQAPPAVAPVPEAPAPAAATAEPATDEPTVEPTAEPKAGHGAQAMLAVVDLRPWAEVLIDGKSKGFSPGRWPVSARAHKIRLVNPDAHLEREFEVRFAAGRTVTLRGSLETLHVP